MEKGHSPHSLLVFLSDFSQTSKATSSYQHLDKMKIHPECDDAWACYWSLLCPPQCIFLFRQVVLFWSFMLAGDLELGCSGEAARPGSSGAVTPCCPSTGAPLVPEATWSISRGTSWLQGCWPRSWCPGDVSSVLLMRGETWGRVDGIFRSTTVCITGINNRIQLQDLGSVSENQQFLGRDGIHQLEWSKNAFANTLVNPARRSFKLGLIGDSDDDIQSVEEVVASKGYEMVWTRDLTIYIKRPHDLGRKEPILRIWTYKGDPTWQHDGRSSCTTSVKWAQLSCPLCERIILWFCDTRTNVSRSSLVGAWRKLSTDNLVMVIGSMTRFAQLC